MTYTFKPYEKTNIVSNHLNMGGTNPDGEEINVTNLYFTRGGRPWIGVMGEYHFERGSCNDWYRELCKMRAGGVSIVSTYIFWIYHEETEGVFDFTGDRDLRRFIKDAERAGLDVVLRIGPWSHGECRNGGFPDWLMEKPFALRDNNAGYMEKARIWYEKIYEQVNGMFYEDGGNIIGIQLDNELSDNAPHLLALKKLALEIGFKAPIYTVTGWDNDLGARIPVDDVVPIFGAYPEEPWNGSTDPLPLSHHYIFSKTRNDAAIGKDILNAVAADGWRLPYERYPYVTCELGGGVQITHHRRPIINPMDVYGLSLVKFGSGNNLIGYYMYKGGTNKLGKTTFNESKESGYPNDCPIMSYDFQAPISEFGEIRGQYRLLNLLHMFALDFGDIIAPMEAVLQKEEVECTDLSELRYCMRTDGHGGFVFINHYQRCAELSDIHNAVIDTGSVKIPPIDVCGEIAFILPFNIDMAGNELEYATAQLLCRAENTFFFAEVKGIQPEYKFSDGSVYRAHKGGIIEHNNIRIVTVSADEAMYMRKLSGTVYIGDGCDLYEVDGTICAVDDGDFEYRVWSGTEFAHCSVKRSFMQASVSFEETEQPFSSPYFSELQIDGERSVVWKKLNVSGDEGFIEIPFLYDTAQIYADGELIADSFYYGKVWRVPAKILCGRECYLAMSELKDDFYREF